MATDDHVAVLHTRSVADLPLVQADLVGADGRMADLFLRFTRETAATRSDAEQLYRVIAEFTFQAFPQATHLVVGLKDPKTGELVSHLASARDGAAAPVPFSQTLASRVMTEGLSLLFAPVGEQTSSESIVRSGIKTAICAPLTGLDKPFGILQLDIRHPGRGRFGRKDLDRVTVFAHQVALVLDNLRLYEEQRRALESTINALVHSLSLKDPDTALHSERVQAVSVLVGKEMGLRGSDLEALAAAAILHDMGKQGIRDEVLLKPGKLTSCERDEMSEHSEHTQDILDKIAYPAHLSEVPRMAAYHHEKMNGTGPYGIPGDEIPIQSRIISVADVFDALFSARVYKKALPLPEVFTILERGKDAEWDGEVVDAVGRTAAAILTEVYGWTKADADRVCGDSGRPAA